jgi:exodeoxyribonuclease VII large subunit
MEDLGVFTDVVVVRAIADSPIPRIRGGGHYTDTTRADLAAPRRAPTPTAAAEIAGPVRRELAAALAELGLRQRKCAMRPVELGRERLASRVARLPRPETLAALPAQRLDELGERLRRGLADRAARARERLYADSMQLSAPLLRARLRAASQALDTVRFGPALLTRPLADRSERLTALGRLLQQLDPKAPLVRGYALVSAPGHPVVASRTIAAAQERLTLEFADGTLEVGPGVAPRAPPRAKPPAAPNEQPKLL